jgi:hypothetical protein
MQEDGAAMGMAYDDEARDTCPRAPDQIQATVAQDERMKLLVDQWIDLATELSDLQIMQTRK